MTAPDPSTEVARLRARRLIAWLRYVVTPRPWPSRWQDRLFRGHVSVGPVVIYGANAMHWAVNVRALGHWWCWHPTTRTFGAYWPAYFYLSKDGTPSAACFIWRSGGEREGAGGP